MPTVKAFSIFFPCRRRCRCRLFLLSFFPLIFQADADADADADYYIFYSFLCDYFLPTPTPMPTLKAFSYLFPCRRRRRCRRDLIFLLGVYSCAKAVFQLRLISTYAIFFLSTEKRGVDNAHSQIGQDALFCWNSLFFL